MRRMAFVVSRPRSSGLRALNYEPGVEALRSAGGRSARLGDLLESLGSAYGTVFTRVDCAPDHGIELLSQSDMFAIQPRGRVIRRDSMARPERHVVRGAQVLVAGAGTLGDNELYGRSLVADTRLEGKYVGPDAIALTFRDPGSDHSLYCAAFLGSSLGISALRSASYGTKILRQRVDVLAELPVPLADDATVGRVAALVRSAVAGRERYAARLAAARDIIEALPEMVHAAELCSERRSYAVMWNGDLPTLRARAYASSGGALSFLRSEWQARLKDVVPQGGLFHGSLRQRTPCDAPHGVDLYSQRDVFSAVRIPRRIAHPGCSDASLFVPKKSLLVASRGQLSEGALFGQVMLGDTFPERSAVTQDILRILPRGELLGAVFTFLTTHVGQVLLRSTASGTSIPILRLDLVKELPFPVLSTAQERELLALVESASAAHRGAQESKNEAVRIIDEEVLPQWLA